MSARRVPVSRRDRPAKPPLSRAGLVVLAFQIMRDEGLDKVTMRRLAGELDTGPASLYVYVRNIAELHGALLDELLAELDLPAVEPAEGWQERLVDLMSAFSVLLMGYPSLARSVLTLHPFGPRYLRLFDTALGLLHVGGVPPRQAAWGVDILIQLATANAAEHGTQDESGTGAEDFETLRSAVFEAPAGRYPHLDRVRSELFGGTIEERMRWPFEALLNGIIAPGG